AAGVWVDPGAAVSARGPAVDEASPEAVSAVPAVGGPTVATPTVVAGATVPSADAGVARRRAIVAGTTAEGRRGDRAGREQKGKSGERIDSHGRTPCRSGGASNVPLAASLRR